MIKTIAAIVSAVVLVALAAVATAAAGFCFGVGFELAGLLV